MCFLLIALTQPHVEESHISLRQWCSSLPWSQTAYGRRSLVRKQGKGTLFHNDVFPRPVPLHRFDKGSLGRSFGPAPGHHEPSKKRQQSRSRRAETRVEGISAAAAPQQILDLSKLVGWTTDLKHISQIWDPFPRGEHKKYLKPPPRECPFYFIFISQSIWPDVYGFDKSNSQLVECSHLFPIIQRWFHKFTSKMMEQIPA